MKEEFSQNLKTINGNVRNPPQPIQAETESMYRPQRNLLSISDV